jgi:Phosphotransferase enzyme family
MGDNAPEQTLVTTDLRKHPAVRAWSEVRQVPLVPESIEILKNRNDSKVYRLAGVGPEGSNVVAKQCPKENALAERFIYEQVLLHLPFPALGHYGLLDEQDSRFCWAFMEDAGGEPYSPNIEEQGVLAAEWLGTLHTCGVEAAAGLSLSDRGPNHYFDCLRFGRDQIRQNLANPALNHNDRAVLSRIARQCDFLEQQWDEIEECCTRIPRTFVHGDLCGSNVHMRATPCGTGLVAFDWECAGWGVLAVDLVLAGLDLPTYHSLVRKLWPNLNLEALQEFAVVGRIFRLLSFVVCESESLAGKWLHKPMKHMRCYQAEIADAIRAAGLEQ